MNFFHHKDLGNHLLQLCPKVVKPPVEPRDCVYCTVNGGECGAVAGSSRTLVFAWQYQSIHAPCSTYFVLLPEGQSWEALESPRSQCAVVNQGAMDGKKNCYADSHLEYVWCYGDFFVMAILVIAPELR